MSRTLNTGKNFIFSIIKTLLTSLLSIVTRTVFIKTIGVEYLGANSLFTNVLSMLSLTELGLSSAIAFSLYKPLAENDIDAIKALMSFYKKAYKLIGILIAVLGVALIPFLKFIIKDSGGIEHINIIYCFFLYNTAFTYFFSYKLTLLSADQKSYLMTNVNMIIGVFTAAVQLIVMLVFKNYWAYLIVGAAINTFQWYFINKFIFKRYPYLREKDARPIDENTKLTLKKNVKALIFHKFGEVCINQTDNIIISSFISITTVGFYNNYYTIINIINTFVQSLFNSAVASLGNLVATESPEKNYDVFKKFNFLGFWLYGWTSICLLVLLDPFIAIWLGEEFLLDKLTIFLVILNYYTVGMRASVGNFKMAAGLYAQDQWVPIVQSIINIVVSIIGVKYMGLAGVFLGTVVSGVSIPCWYRPMIVYKHVFKRSSVDYFKSYFLYAAVIAVCYGAVELIVSQINALNANIYFLFLLKAAVCAVLPNAVIIILFRKSDEFKYLCELAKAIIGRKLK